MLQHYEYADEDLDVCHLFLPEDIVSALRNKADEQSLLLHNFVNGQAERLLVEPSFFDEALELADALWERLACGPSGPFPWPADPLLCVGAALVFAADLKSQVQKDLLILDDTTVKRLGKRAADRGVSYQQLVNETVARFWKTGLRVKGPDPRGEGAWDHRGSDGERRASGVEMIARLDFTVEHGAPEPDSAGAHAGKAGANRCLLK